MWQTASLANPFALTTEYDFLQILLDELARKGHPYDVASVGEVFSASLPIDGQTLVRWTDRNAIIVRSSGSPDLLTENPSHGVYQQSLPLTVGGQPLNLTRGWASADVKMKGRWFRVISTHLEAYHPVVRTAQTVELATLASASPLPVVLLGDLNWYPAGAT